MAFEPHILSFHILAPNTCGPCHPFNPYCFLEPSGVQFSPVPPSYPHSNLSLITTE